METGALQGGLGLAASDQPGALQDTIDGRGSGRDYIGVENHVRQAAIAFQKMLEVEVDDGLFLLLVQPVIARNPGIVFVDFAAPLFPVAIGSIGNSEPLHELQGGDLGSFLPPLRKGSAE